MKTIFNITLYILLNCIAFSIHSQNSDEISFVTYNTYRITQTIGNVSSEQLSSDNQVRFTMDMPNNRIQYFDKTLNEVGYLYFDDVKQNSKGESLPGMFTFLMDDNSYMISFKIDAYKGKSLFKLVVSKDKIRSSGNKNLYSNIIVFTNYDIVNPHNPMSVLSN